MTAPYVLPKPGIAPTLSDAIELAHANLVYANLVYANSCTSDKYDKVESSKSKLSTAKVG